MHDALATAAEAMQGDAVLSAVGFQCGQHLLGERIGEGTRLARGGHDVIHRGNGALGVAHTQAEIPQGREGLRAGDLMNQMQADEQLRCASGQLGHLMQIPDLVVEGAGAHVARTSRRDEAKAERAWLNPAGPGAAG